MDQMFFNSPGYQQFLRWNVFTPCSEKHPEHSRLSLEEGIFSFNNFSYDYFWHNWPSNERSILHLTHCLLLHYLGKP